MKQSNDLKLKKLIAVKRYLSGDATYRELAGDLGVSKSTLQRWVIWYKTHGSFDEAAPAASYSAEFKLSALQHMWDNRLSYSQTTLHFKIAGYDLLRRWARLFNARGVAALMPDPPQQTQRMTIPSTNPEEKIDPQPTQKELLEQIAYLKMENAYLKKLHALVQSQESKAPVKKRK